jgi:putative two-component system response regulator
MHIMIIDDNKETLLLLDRLVKVVAPFTVPATFQDPRRGLEACRTDLPDLLLVDFQMPGLNGLEVVEEVRRLPGGEGLLIVMVTATTERDIRHRALDMGITDFLNKPIDPSEFRARLRNLLALRRAHLQLTDHNAWLAEEVAKATRVIHEREEELIHRLATAAEFRDPETGGHILRMAHYSHCIAQYLGLDGRTCELLLKAAPMHDVGKLGIPDAILLKPGRLEPEEMAIMRRHPAIGHGILSGSASGLIQMGAEIALSHHEKWDGSGYPQGLAGERIPICARIVAVADVFDALTTERPYKRAWTLDQARTMLVEGAGAHFDPRCVEAFLAVWDDLLRIRDSFAEAPSGFCALESLRVC